ncbi:PSD1 and planctomycete cytochrome C domain-containing protein [Rhodopirellula sp.]|nr:PSD1 and planctomycete cytochrome C domain-containing protein [Rhodopirellula sp.]MDB4678906.1 PSD1 and planctomycete cytochrome C domain-containing protein [Rhodopirellula sp.]
MIISKADLNNPRWLLNCFAVAVLSLGCWLHPVDAADNDVLFTRDIQPLLAKHCLLCHGVDDSEGGLQLHQSDLATREVDSGHRAIVPGKIEQSELLKRVVSDDPELRMPPDGERLSTGEIQKLSDWIEQGAKWEVHWAYQPLQPASPPSVTDEALVRNEIDRYVIAKLQELDIDPSPEADRPTLIKRLHYDLIGLPPSPAEVRDFVSDTSADAYEKVVRRLLASKHFGERWGRHWLDMARYADSDGYEKDNHRADAWRYRDWVIRAINRDMPFNQFTIEQLAGDLLPNAGVDQRLATAFHRQTLTNTEGGTDQEQWRVAAVMDRTETVGTVWMGLSVGCARCHSHKYDQITHQEYYQLYSYFNNADEVTAEVPKSSSITAEVESEINSIEIELSRRKQELAKSSDQWLPDLRLQAARLATEGVKYHPLDSVVVRGPEGVTFKRLEDGSYLVEGQNPETAKYTIEGLTPVDGVSGVRLEVLPDESLSAKGPGRTSHGNFVLNEIRIRASASRDWKDQGQRKLVNATADFSQDGWGVKGAFDGVEGAGKEGTGWAISPKFGSEHTATFALADQLDDGNRNLQIVLSQTYGGQHTIGRFRISAITGRLPGVGMDEEIRNLLVRDQIDDAAMQRLLRYQQDQDTASLKLTDQLSELIKKRDSQLMKVRVIAERQKNPRATHVLKRGEFKQPMEQVQTGTFTTLPTIRPREGKSTTDRLDLARWLVSGDNPIVARVTVNHVWKHLFGVGIVPTVNDFGVRGDAPSHFALLDFLAEHLIASQWSRKQLIETIVLSATYRQSSRHRPELFEVDPNNRWLHRQNRYRVEAEVMRDIALAASGLLSRKIGGPSVFPPIPPSVTDLTYNSGFKWKQSEGEDRYRRGMYTYFKRTAPHPNLITFDCPDSNVTNVKRDRSNTPIGALVTLNNETFVEASQALVQRVFSDESLDNDQARLRQAIELCVARVPTREELADFETLLERSRDWYGEHSDDAKAMVGQRPVESIDVADNAAWVATLRIVLNLDEFITRE